MVISGEFLIGFSIVRVGINCFICIFLWMKGEVLLRNIGFGLLGGDFEC